MSAARVSRGLREEVAFDSRHRCGYCLTAESVVGMPMEIDHLIPRSLGGETARENLWLACTLCNDHKSDRVAAIDPLTGENVRLYDPRRQLWTEHFAWSPAGELIIGQTACGRATVAALKMNRPR